MTDNAQDPEAPGWDAITAAFDALYPGIEPAHVGYTPGLAFGGGLQGCSAYRAEDHWHYVTYGLTELWDKSPKAEPGISGWGYELTLRTPPDEGGDTPPRWPFALLEQVARMSNQHGTLYRIGDRIDTRQPLTGEPGTALTVLAVMRDPQFADAIESPNGSFDLLQIVGVTADELVRMKATSTAEVLDSLAADGNALLVTDPRRAR